MVRVKQYDTYPEVWADIGEQLDNNYFGYYNLYKALGQLEEGRLPCFDAFKVYDGSGHKVVSIIAGRTLFLYGEDWNEQLLSTIATRLRPIKNQVGEILGQRNLVESYLQVTSIQLDSRKNRIAYSCSKVKFCAPNRLGSVENASNEYIEQLIELSKDYYKFEFGDKGVKTAEEVAQNVRVLVGNTNRLFSVRVGPTIQSILTIIGYHDGYAMLGSLYTRKNSRGQGHGYSLLSTVTHGLLDQGFKQCGLLSNADDGSSNALFTKVGYEPTYHLVSVYPSRPQ